MKHVYILVEERETSVSCCIHGVWTKREDACKEMIKSIKNNNLYTEKSKVDLNHGIAESDPDYCENEYCNYSVIKYDVL